MIHQSMQTLKNAYKSQPSKRRGMPEAAMSGVSLKRPPPMGGVAVSRPETAARRRLEQT